MDRVENLIPKHNFGHVDDCIDLDFDDKSQGWIDQIDDETLREVVQDQFDQWFEYNEEILRQNEYEAKE